MYETKYVLCAQPFEIITPPAIVPDEFLSSGFDGSWGQLSAGKY